MIGRNDNGIGATIRRSLMQINPPKPALTRSWADRPAGRPRSASGGGRRWSALKAAQALVLLRLY
jgi:hypothetical protein